MLANEGKEINRRRREGRYVGILRTAEDSQQQPLVLEENMQQFL
jgi:hypothetical protein